MLGVSSSKSSVFEKESLFDKLIPDFLGNPEIVKLVLLGLFLVLVFVFISKMLSLVNKTDNKEGKKFKNDADILNPKQGQRDQSRQNNKMFIINKGFFGKRKFKNTNNTLLLSQNVKLMPSKTNEHIVAFGPTGTGKSATILIPQLLNVDGASLIVVDPKGELHHKTKSTLESKGYKVVHLNLNNHEKSIGYNLLKSCRSSDEVRDIGKTVMANTKNEEWANLSAPLLNAFALRQWRLGGSLSDVSDDLVRAPSNFNELELEWFDEVEFPEAYISFLQFKQSAGSEGLLSSMKTVVNTALQVFSLEILSKIEGKEHFDVTRLRYEKVALFISYNENKTSLFAFFLSPFFKQIIDKIKEEYDETNDKEINQVFFLIDEFANIGKIPDFQNVLTTVRSKKMSIEIFLQSIPQVESVYGKNESQIILEGCKTKIALDSINGDSSKYLQDFVGTRDIKKVSSSRSHDGKISQSTNIETKQILSSDRIRRLNSYDCLIITANLLPIKDFRNFYYLSKMEFGFLKLLGKMGVDMDLRMKVINFFKSKK